MLELARDLLPLVERGTPVALATSIDVIGSAPHLAGTSMAVTPDGVVLGSVSGGCVEAAALTACRALLAGGRVRVRRYGFGDEAAAQAGLACGGELDVLVHPAAGSALAAELRAAAAGRPAAVGLITAGPSELVGRTVAAMEGAAVEGEHVGPLDGSALRRIREAVLDQARRGRSGGLEVELETGSVRVFADVRSPAPSLVIVGATSTAAALATAGAAVGYAVTVCDPRPAFARAGRFPGARVVVGLPHAILESMPIDGCTAVCLLSHDEDLDPLAVAVALERGAGYVGALGSRATAARRAERLRALGVDEALLARLHAPIGLDLGASTPAETAVSILAEVLAVRTGSVRTPLREGSGPIHAPRASGVQVRF